MMGTKEVSHSVNPEIEKKAVEETVTDMEPEVWLSAIPMDAVLCLVWFAGVLFCLIYVVCSLAANRRMFRHTTLISEFLCSGSEREYDHNSYQQRDF